MKRFVVSILFASVFFMGIGSIVESVGAKFKSDQKALEIIARARTAIGGDDNIRDVRSMTIIGSTTNFYDKNGVPTTELGGTEINFELPGKFSKMVKIGDPNAAGDADVRKEVNVVVVGKRPDGADMTAPHPGDGNEIVIVRKGGDDVEWTSEDKAEFRSEGGKLILKKEDGSVVELPEGAKHKVRVHKGSGDAAVWNTEDGKKIIVETDSTDFAHGHRSSGGEMLRTLTALLMTAPDTLDVSYKFAGEGDVDGYPCDIVEVTSAGESFKVFVDSSSSLPRMISYTAPHAVFVTKVDEGSMSKEMLIEMKRDMAKPVETQVRFSDFRSIGGLVLPHRWTQTVGGKQSQIFDVTSYEINPANIADKFGDQKVFIRKMKPESN